MTHFTIPELRTARLVLRPQCIDDFPAYAAFLASPRSRFMGGPFDQRAAWGMFTSDLAMWPLYGHGSLMIDIAATGQCIGQVGINHGPLFPKENSAGCSMRASKGRALPPKLAPHCAIGRSTPWVCRRWSATSTQKTMLRWLSRRGSAESVTMQRPCRMRAMWCFATVYPREAFPSNGHRTLLRP